MPTRPKKLLAVLLAISLATAPIAGQPANLNAEMQAMFNEPRRPVSLDPEPPSWRCCALSHCAFFPTLFIPSHALHPVYARANHLLADWHTCRPTAESKG